MEWAGFCMVGPVVAALIMQTVNTLGTLSTPTMLHNCACCTAKRISVGAWKESIRFFGCFLGRGIYEVCGCAKQDEEVLRIVVEQKVDVGHGARVDRSAVGGLYQRLKSHEGMADLGCFFFHEWRIEPGWKVWKHISVVFMLLPRFLF